ncbi:hypothetical protein ES703_64648 [subsurface metagenome]
MSKLRGTSSAKYITSPPIIPVLPFDLGLPNGLRIPTRKALPIARAVLLAAVEALKQIPGGADRTVYSMERACFHLKRVKVEERK